MRNALAVVLMCMSFGVFAGDFILDHCGTNINEAHGDFLVQSVCTGKIEEGGATGIQVGFSDESTRVYEIVGVSEGAQQSITVSNLQSGEQFSLRLTKDEKGQFSFIGGALEGQVSFDAPLDLAQESSTSKAPESNELEQE